MTWSSTARTPTASVWSPTPPTGSPSRGALAARAADFDTTVVDESDQIVLIAVQGPRSLEILETVPELDLEIPARHLKYYRSSMGTYRGLEAMVGRTGYTGEDGFEFYVRNGVGAQLWDDLTAGGAELGLVPAGLASRDTLRLEAGMPLYGHELGEAILPVQSGLGRVVNLGKEGDFVGRAATEAGPPEGARVLVGLAAEGRRAGRADYPVVDADGTEVGIITSGALSPTLGHPVAMAYVDPQLAEVGTPLFLDVRGTSVPASVVPLPFYKREAR